MFKKFFSKTLVIFFIFTSLVSAEISYREILDNPTDLELNLNYAKQQEKAGNLKLTISTLERMSMLYPSNTEIKLYLLTIVVKMDSPAKLSLLVQQIMLDPNTTIETKKLVAELLDDEGKLAEPSKWFAYMDLSYSQTEHSNYDSYPESRKRLLADSLQNFALPNLIEYDKSYKKGSALTVGKNIDDTSSIFLNLGLDITTLNKKDSGESDVINTSVSYFKIIGKHYITPYAYYSKPNYRKAADLNVKGLGINNTYIINKKNNLNYAASYANTEYHTTTTFVDDALQNNDIYSLSLKHNYNIANKNKFGTKLLYSETNAHKAHYDNSKLGFELSYAHILPFGTVNLSSQISEKFYPYKNSAISSIHDRKDHNIFTKISLRGQLKQLLPFVKSLNKKNDIFYNIKYTDSRTDSNIHTHTVEKDTLTFGLTKRLNFNGLFD